MFLLLFKCLNDAPPFLYDHVICLILFPSHCLPCCAVITSYIFTQLNFFKLVFCFNFATFFSLDFTIFSISHYFSIFIL